MCVYIAIIAIILQVMLWCMDSAPALKWLLVGIFAGKMLGERQCILEGKAQYVNVQSSVHWEGV